MSDVDMPNAPDSKLEKLSTRDSQDTESITSSIQDINSPLPNSDDKDDGNEGTEKNFHAEFREAYKKAVELEARGLIAELSPTQLDPVEIGSPNIIRAELPDS